MSELQIKWYESALRELLQGRTGPVAQDLARRAERVVAQAKQNATGMPHGYYKGILYPSAPRSGQGPGVRSGIGRASITYVIGIDSLGVYADVGSNQSYMAILEVSGLYPWLVRALPAAAD